MVAAIAQSSAASNPVAAASGMSKSKTGTLSVLLTGIAVADVPTHTLSFGKAASRPTHYSDLINPNDSALTPQNWDRLQVVQDGSSIATINAAFAAVLGNAAWTPGDNVWIALFSVTPPIAGSVPVATSGPFAVTA